MSIIAIMVPAIAMAATEDMLRASFNKANKFINRINHKRKVRERRSRSQRRWA